MANILQLHGSRFDTRITLALEPLLLNIGGETKEVRVARSIHQNHSFVHPNYVVTDANTGREMFEFNSMQLSSFGAGDIMYQIENVPGALGHVTLIVPPLGGDDEEDDESF